MSLISYQNARIEALSVHWVGNRSQEEPVVLSKSPQQLNDEKVHDRLLKFFLNNFRDRLLYSFAPATAPENNPLYKIAGDILSKPFILHDKSIEIANMLYDVSTHHWIKNGECWVVRFSNVSYNNEPVNAVGIFKTELKEEFLTVKRRDQAFLISLHEGFNIKKLDKGCLILERSPEKGYEIMIVDNISLQDPAEYWKEKFLNVKPVKTPFYNTSNEFRVLRAFLDDPGNTVEPLEKAERLNNSVNYMKEKERFDVDEFEKNLFPEQDMRNSYDKFRKQYRDEYDVEIEDEYDIEPQVVKNPGKFVRSVIKLDKNFHIYVHGNRSNIMKGFDEEKGMSYYKIYFSEES